MTHPYFLENLVRDHQAELLAEAAHDRRADQFLRARRINFVIRRPVRVVRDVAAPLHRPTAA
jgi:hypothetical protein